MTEDNHADESDEQSASVTERRDPADDPREQELIWPARRHPDELILPDVHATRFPGTWVAIYDGSIPADQRGALRVEGFSVYRIRLLPEQKAQVIIREGPHPDERDELERPKTAKRYAQYDPQRSDERR